MKSFSNYCVNTSVLKSNANNIKNLIGENVKLCAVVKANAYGAGLNAVCSALSGVVDFFACACLKEALQIRVFDKKTKVLILGMTNINDFDIIASENISISVGSLDYLEKLVKSADKCINIHLQVNTGLNRFGFKTITEFKKALKLIKANKNIVLEGVYSHFATKQNNENFINKQYSRFLQFKKYVKENVIFHIANSYATTLNPRYHLNMVRCGFLLYGYLKNKIGNRPIVSITSKIVHKTKVKRRETIGYDRTFRADKDLKIGVVPIGYADGLNRKLSNNFRVLVGNKECRILGLICMDIFLVDITDCNVTSDTVVTILGRAEDKEISILDMASTISASPYEIICGFRYNRMNYIVKE